MRFAVDAHVIGRHLTGNEVYVRNLLAGFAELDRESDFIAYLSMPHTGPLVPDRFTTRLVSTNPFVRLGHQLSRRVREDRPDLLHVQYTAPLACPVPVVVSVHDVSFLEHPEFFIWSRAFQLRRTVSRTIRSAARIITPSEFSRRTIVRAYGLTGENIVVVPAAVSPLFRTIARENAAAAVTTRFGIPGPYVLSVGDLQPRKNQIGLIQAFEDLIRSQPRLPHRLVLVGQDTWFGGRVRAAAERSDVADRIHFTGFVNDEDLVQLYGGCDLFVFPSFYEGFGFPVLEAMACGRAVACSRCSAIPEVADAAAIFFDPHSVSDIARAMRDVLLDNELRSRMERLGQQNAARFSWERTARRTLEVYYDVAGAGRKRASQVSAARS
jgi:glycosyltransferase involved in cell wall biosynthesis